ncbi:hypothetical protein DGG96_08965 [Legionella qingyii]|uniref:Uncharacterized protein n=1 Tax=Legionella qingyii TaxID=2184757 RepID=A0A317U5F1_9GAMM|nr:hypothetical protein [Legionella qingyii]PWY56056.1 hypothetical protein DGG96_08965 [Legionella qingyii]RUR22059.1 hypothetical protein ELY20_10885 [Legionella qingyii]RUR25639.1 hypothetical protein ELY16_09695 [Legionella qingyii]
MKKFILLFIVFLTIETTNAAVLNSGPFPFDGGESKPYSFLKVMIPRITKATYVITCDIINPNYQKEYPVVLQMKLNVANQNPYKIYLNGAQLSSPYYQGELNRNINHLMIFPVEINGGEADSHIQFHNLDDSDTVIVSNCEARFLTSSS